ncbi:MAG: hypothetical protein WC854_05025 [Bacteroidales bacterium]
MDLQNITLISFGHFEEDFLKNIAEAVKHEFRFSVNIKEGHLDLSEFYDPGRRQYNGIKLLKKIDSIYSSDSDKSLGLFSVDRFKKEVIHELGHTFGLIHCHIPTCVMRSSTYVEDRTD